MNMMDKTVALLFGMVGTVALTGIFLLIFTQGSASSSSSLTGYVIGGDTGANTRAPAASTPAISADAPIPVRPAPTPFTRTLTIFSVAFLLGIAGYVYFHPQY